MDESTARMVLELRTVQAQVQELQRQLSALQSYSTELAIAVSTLKGVKDAKDGALLPVGGGVFVRATMPAGEVLAEIGAGVVVEKSVDEASAILESKLAEVNKAGEKLAKDLNLLMARNDELVDVLNSRQEE